jgi:hypothetical protein
MRFLLGVLYARTAVIAAVREDVASQAMNYTYDPHVVAYPTVCMAAPTRTQNSLREREQSIVFDAESFDLLIDNCASVSITNSLNDFTSPPVPSNTKIVGINGTTEASLVGTVRWAIEDDLGRVHQIILPGTYYSASARSRLLSPQHWAQQAEDNYPAPNGTWCATYAKKIKLYWDQQKYSRTVYLSPRSNVGVLRTAPSVEKYAKTCARIEERIGTVAMPTVIETEDFYEGEDKSEKSETNVVTDSMEEGESTSITSIEEADKQTQGKAEIEEVQEDTTRPKTLDLLLQEEDLEEEQTVQFTSKEQEYMHWHVKLGHASQSRMRQLSSNGYLPKYLAKIQPPICSACLHGKATKVPWKTKGDTKQTPRKVTRAGECVAVDQMESTTPGFIGQLKGTLTTLRYRYATIFVDMYSDYTYVYLHTKITSEETVKAKVAFETHAKMYGVTIQQYHADNGRFQDTAFKNACKEQGQELSFCGVNAHFQNGRAERKIRDLQDRARTSLLHAIRKWPQAITINLWPYAMRYANDVNNARAKKGEKSSPQELFSGITTKLPLRQFQPFGCPTYVLDSDLQAGKRAGSKWKDRARLGINLGFSPQHARSVHLILSLTTGCVSPQFHCKFDTHFSTLQEYQQPTSLWQEKAQFVPKKERYAEQTPFQRSNENSTTTAPGNAREDFNPQDDFRAVHPEDRFVIPETPNEEVMQRNEGVNEANNEPVVQQEDQTNTRRSGRVRRQPQRFEDYVPHEQIAFEALTYPMEQEDYSHPITAMKSTSDPDTMYLWQAQKEEDFPQFQAAMQKEIDDHTSRGNWKLIPRKDLPKGATVLPSVWAMKRKRRISTREIYKWKARINIDGSKQVKGVHYEQTYSPVVAWSTTRFLLIQSLLQKWHTKQLDFVLAFPQAKVERDLYMEIPKGVRLQGADRSKYVLQLVKNLYGQKQAGRVWYQHLVRGLQEIGFTRSKVDECVFYYKQSVLLIYVDDSILMGPNEAELEYLVKQMGKRFEIQEEGNLGDFLGIQIAREPDGNLTLTQPQLIESILQDLGLDKKNVKGRTTPALKTVLIHKDPDGEPFDNSFHYRSVTGKLNYLEKSTRPEIAYAVHQCARYCNSPKASHGEAIKRIG